MASKAIMKYKTGTITTYYRMHFGNDIISTSIKKNMNIGPNLDLTEPTDKLGLIRVNSSYYYADPTYGWIKIVLGRKEK